MNDKDKHIWHTIFKDGKLYLRLVKIEPKPFDLFSGLTDEQWQEIIDDPNTYDAEGDDDDD